MNLMISEAGNTPAVQPPKGANSQLALQERMAEIQMRYMCARQFPRDIVQIEHQIKLACGRYALAEMARYALPIQGKTVSDGSIRLAEVLAQIYGNLDIGKEITGTGRDEEGKYTDLRVYALDLETGSRFQEVIRVYHHRFSKQYGKKTIDDPSELERVFAQHAAKRMRECIFKAIPRDLKELALSVADATVKKGPGDKPLFERVKAMVLEFERLGVTREQLEKKVGCNIDLFTADHFAELAQIYRSLRDGVAKASDFFEVEEKQSAGLDELKQRLQKNP